MKEHYYDKLLNIKTSRDPYSSHYFHYHPYEPTPYHALEELFARYEVKRTDRIVDFGCGKGRLNFYTHYLFKATVVGVEMNEDLYQMAEKNRKSYVKEIGVSAEKIQFYCCLAEEYPIHPSDNRFYFFNPFSIHIFMKIIGNILRSFERAPRELELLLYYPSDDYIYFLENETPFDLKQEIVLKELYENNPYERFLIYGLRV